MKVDPIVTQDPIPPLSSIERKGTQFESNDSISEEGHCSWFWNCLGSIVHAVKSFFQKIFSWCCFCCRKKNSGPKDVIAPVKKQVEGLLEIVKKAADISKEEEVQNQDGAYKEAFHKLEPYVKKGLEITAAKLIWENQLFKEGVQDKNNPYKSQEEALLGAEKVLQKPTNRIFNLAFVFETYLSMLK